MSKTLADNENVDSRHTSHSKVSIYESSSYNSSARLESNGLGTCKIYLHEDTTSTMLKLDYHTMIVIRDVLNRWHEEQVVKRGKE